MSEWTIPNLREAQPGLYTSGAVAPEQLDELDAHGVKTVVNLCPHEEIGWDEAGEVSRRDMNYVNIPVAGPADLTPENARRLDEALSGSGGEPVLVHCQSSNRVGALFAISAFLDGKSQDEALSIGRATGLTRLEPVVAALLARHAAEQG